MGITTKLEHVEKFHHYSQKQYTIVGRIGRKKFLNNPAIIVRCYLSKSAKCRGRLRDLSKTDTTVTLSLANNVQ